MRETEGFLKEKGGWHSYKEISEATGISAARVRRQVAGLCKRKEIVKRKVRVLRVMDYSGAEIKMYGVRRDYVVTQVRWAGA